jgi:hypothetical protein
LGGEFPQNCDLSNFKGIFCPKLLLKKKNLLKELKYDGQIRRADRHRLLGDLIFPFCSSLSFCFPLLLSRDFASVVVVDAIFFCLV